MKASRLPSWVSLLVAIGAGMAGAGALSSCGNVIRKETGATGANTGGAGATGAAHGGSTSGGPHACTAGFADCNGDPTDACETNLGNDPAHCGSCDHDCLGSACTGALCEPEVLASDLYFPNNLALDETRLYWTSPDGKIRALPLDGGTLDILAMGQSDPWDLTVDAAGLYWTNGGGNTVQSQPFGSGLPVLLSDAGNPLRIAVHKGIVYYTDTYDKGSPDEHVVRVPAPGGPAQIVASSMEARGLAVDDQRVYWTDPANHAVWSAPSTGGDPTLMATLLEPDEIEVDEAAVYVTGLEGTFRIPLAGGAPQKLVSGAGLGLAIDATYLFVGAADGRLLRVPKTGGTPVALSRADPYPIDIVVGDHEVFWITRTMSGELLRTPK